MYLHKETYRKGTQETNTSVTSGWGEENGMDEDARGQDVSLWTPFKIILTFAPCECITY